MSVDHKPITIILNINDEKKRFVTPKDVKGSLWREAALVAEEIEQQQIMIADLDSHMQFVCNVFGNQFTLTEFEEGIDSRDLIKTIYASAIFVMGQVSVAAKMLTGNVDLGAIDEKKKLSETVMDAYNNLIDLGYTQNQIDEMDILYHLELLGRRKQAKETKEDEILYIDDLGI